MPQSSTARASVLSVRGMGLSRQQHMAQSHRGSDAQAGCRWPGCGVSESPGQRGQLLQAGWSPDSHTQAFQSGSGLGREVEQAAALLTPSFAAQPVLGTRTDPVCAAGGTEGRLCPPYRGRCPCGAALYMDTKWVPIRALRLADPFRNQSRQLL